MPIIYCVEDDENIRELIVYALNSNGYKAIGFEGSEELYEKLENSPPELILLDVMLPGENGLKILEYIRGNFKTSEIPVIMISAKDSEFDKVKGLDLGADDYITKPFGVMELLSRVKAILRRLSPDKKSLEKLTLGDITIDYEKRLVYVGDNLVNLTYKEFELLYYLFNNRGIVLTRENIMNEVWGFNFEGETRTVDVHIATLRHKLGKYGNIIETIRSVGYKVGDTI